MKKLTYLFLALLIFACSGDDNTAPVVTLIGESSITVTQNTTYEDAGAIASDNVDGDLTSNIVTTSNVDTSTLGTYTVTHSVSDASGNNGSASRQVGVVDGETSDCNLSMPLSFDIALWHEGYSTHTLMTPMDLGNYLDALLRFVDGNNFKTVFISVPTKIPTVLPEDNQELEAKLISFTNSLIEKEIGIGIQFGLDNGPASDPEPGNDWFDYDQVSSVVGNHPYILGLDSENYNLNGATINAVNTMEFINDIESKIIAAGGPIPTDIAVASTAGYNPANNWSSPLINIYEYYSSPDTLNEIFSSNVNDPTTAFNQCLALPIKDPTAEGGGIQGGSVKGWPAFSFEQANENCLAGSFGTVNNTCGVTEILGDWEYDCILQFMTLFKEHYYPSPSDKPTFVLYQSDFLPCNWIPNGCP
tara:strand:- start:3121 stop:4371 length:1251 start_codon:yes stop_codon:yes gene_type:complete